MWCWGENEALWTRPGPGHVGCLLSCSPCRSSVVTLLKLRLVVQCELFSGTAGKVHFAAAASRLSCLAGL